jgi:hypothetical protein
MTLYCKLAAFAAAMLLATSAWAQAAPSNDSKASASAVWEFAITGDGYIVPHQDGYFSPTLAADHGWLHLEARYNYENLRTGSLWAGYNFTAGKKLVFKATPMIGGVFGRTNGIAPGCEASLTYKTISLSVSNEYVFDTGIKRSNFYYAWPQLTYSPVEWFRIGLVAQRTKAYHTTLDTQRGFLAGISHKNLEFTTYVFNAGWTTPTVVLEASYSFPK